MRDAVATVRQLTPDRYHEHPGELACHQIGAHYAHAFAGVPATSRTRSEDVVLYRAAGQSIPVLLGLYGDETRIRSWLPGYPDRVDPTSAGILLATARPPIISARSAEPLDVDLHRLPALRLTDRDAGAFLTMGLVYARGARGSSLSVHRMLVINGERLTVWMVPGRNLARLHADAARAGGRLPVSVNIGAPPAAMIASALGGRFLPAGLSKLDVAGALAGSPITLAAAATQPVSVLADSEIVLEGHLDATTADETLGARVGSALPEFSGYHGSGRRNLPVLTVTGMTVRPNAVYQAVIGPGREQSVILGLAGALSVALSAAGGPRPEWGLVRDLHFSAAGGGMVMLAVSLGKRSPKSDSAAGTLAASIFQCHPFVRLVVFVDDDVDIRCAEDLWWAVSTRTNLSADCVTLAGYSPVPMIPAESDGWKAERDGTGRSFIDATAPYRARRLAERCFT